MVATGAVAAIAGGTVIARADDGPSAKAAQASGGLSLSPVMIERPAAVGAANVVTVANKSEDPLAVTVAARPWTQSASGAVSPNRRGTLGAVSLSDDSFTLAPGASKPVTVTLRSAPTGGSLYGALEVVGLPADAKKRKGVTLGYRLLSSLRLNSSTPTYGLKGGSVKVTGKGSKRVVTLSVRNTGNTIEPVTGAVRLRGPLGTQNGTIKATRILPGKTVRLALGTGRSLPAGSYSATITLTQAQKRTTITKKIRVRR
jgi:hypothetical protein